MNPIVLWLVGLTVTEAFFTGIGLTFCLLLVSRIGYCCNTFGLGLKVKTCAIWEGMSLGWVIMKTIIFKSVFFNWKYTLVVVLYSLVCLAIEFYDASVWSYVVEDSETEIEEKSGHE